MTVHLIQRVALVPDGMGRSTWVTELQPGRGYFTTPEEAQPALDRLNVPARAEFERQEALRRAAATERGLEMKDSSIEEYPHIPRFVLIEVPHALDGHTPDDHTSD